MTSKLLFLAFFFFYILYCGQCSLISLLQSRNLVDSCYPPGAKCDLNGDDDVKCCSPMVCSQVDDYNGLCG